MAKRRRKLGLSSHAVTSEIEIFGDNDGFVYNRCIRPLQESGIKHAKKGKFNPIKFCKAMRKRCVPLIIKQYAKEFGEIGATVADKNVAGASLCKTSISRVSEEVGKNVLKLPRS